MLDALCTTDILVIDDFGVERPADWINDKLYQILNERYINRKVTIFTSNESLETLQYDDLASPNRIKERTYQYRIPGRKRAGSYRKQLTSGGPMIRKLMDGLKHQRKQKKPLQVRNYSYHKSHVLNLPTPVAAIAPLPKGVREIHKSNNDKTSGA